jgi:hypothetical protein
VDRGVGFLEVGGLDPGEYACIVEYATSQGPYRIYQRFRLLPDSGVVLVDASPGSTAKSD